MKKFRMLHSAEDPEGNIIISKGPWADFTTKKALESWKDFCKVLSERHKRITFWIDWIDESETELIEK